MATLTTHAKAPTPLSETAAGSINDHAARSGSQNRPTFSGACVRLGEVR